MKLFCYFSLVLFILAGCSTDNNRPILHNLCCVGHVNREDNIYISDRVEFAPHQPTLTSAAMDTLGKQAGWLKKYESVKVSVEGYADDGGNDKANKELALRRAYKVRLFLIGLGVDHARVTAKIAEAYSNGDRKTVTVITQ